MIAFNFFHGSIHVEINKYVFLYHTNIFYYFPRVQILAKRKLMSLHAVLSKRKFVKNAQLFRSLHKNTSLTTYLCNKVKLQFRLVL